MSTPHTLDCLLHKSRTGQYQACICGAARRAAAFSNELPPSQVLGPELARAADAANLGSKLRAGLVEIMIESDAAFSQRSQLRALGPLSPSGRGTNETASKLSPGPAAPTKSSTEWINQPNPTNPREIRDKSLAAVDADLRNYQRSWQTNASDTNKLRTEAERKADEQRHWDILVKQGRAKVLSPKRKAKLLAMAGVGRTVDDNRAAREKLLQPNAAQLQANEMSKSSGLDPKRRERLRRVTRAVG